MSAENITFKLDGVEYLWGGYLGAILYSTERCVWVGDTRIIDGVLFKAYSISARPFWFAKAQVRWTFAGDDPTLGDLLEQIRQFKSKLFNLEMP